MLIFSENGYPIANKDSLNPEVKILFADRTMEEPQKHRVAPKNNYYSIQNEKEKHEDKDETYFVGWSLCHW
uniref:Uncharacterized protein n=1 Tax=Panagrolaimus sp. ES5 TaxID=591445 RepID=A0AC34G9Q9_9BILA